jgi:Flp pilus assembly protein TadD
MADRYVYLAAVGLSLPLAWGLQELAGSKARRAQLVAVLLCAVVLTLISRRQVEIWRDHATLFQHAAEVTEGNYLAHYNVGTHFLRGTPARIGEARPHLEAAVRLDPKNPGAHLNLGAVDWMEGRIEEATHHYEEAVRLAPTNSEAHLSLGTARYERGREGEAIRHFEYAVKLDPENAKALSNLGTVYLALERTEDARGAFARALELAPTMPEALAGMRAAGQPGVDGRSSSP